MYDEGLVAGKGHKVFDCRVDAGCVSHVFECYARQARYFFGYTHLGAHISLKVIDYFAIFEFDSTDFDYFGFFRVQPRGFEVEGYVGVENGHGE